MNELRIDSQKEFKTPFNNPMLLILLIPFLRGFLSNNHDNIFNSNNTFSLDLKSIDLKKIFDKMNVLIEVAPYLPSDVVTIVNRYMPIYDKFSKAFLVIDLFSRTNTAGSIVTATDLSQREKFNKVSYILEKNLPENEYKTVKPFIDIATNIDKYKGIVEGLKMLNNPEANKSNQLETLIKIAGPLLGQDEKSMEKINEMVKMMELINLFNDEEEEENTYSNDKDKNDEKSKEKKNN